MQDILGINVERQELGTERTPADMIHASMACLGAFYDAPRKHLNTLDPATSRIYKSILEEPSTFNSQGTHRA